MDVQGMSVSFAARTCTSALPPDAATFLGGRAMCASHGAELMQSSSNGHVEDCITCMSASTCEPVLALKIFRVPVWPMQYARQPSAVRARATACTGPCCACMQ